jgi:hypothetical protein
MVVKQWLFVYFTMLNLQKSEWNQALRRRSWLAKRSKAKDISKAPVESPLGSHEYCFTDGRVAGDLEQSLCFGNLPTCRNRLEYATTSLHVPVETLPRLCSSSTFLFPQFSTFVLLVVHARNVRHTINDGSLPTSSTPLLPHVLELFCSTVFSCAKHSAYAKNVIGYFGQRP